MFRSIIAVLALVAIASASEENGETFEAAIAGKAVSRHERARVGCAAQALA